MTGKCPLNKDTWDRFVSGALSEAERTSLIGHLENDCGECDRFFEELGSDAAAQGLLWASNDILDTIAERMHPDEGTCDNICRTALNEANNTLKKLPLIRTMRSLYIPGAAVAVALIVFSFIYLIPGYHNGIKGTDVEPPSVSLQVAVLKGDSSSDPIRGIPGESYRPEDMLFFRYELRSRGYIYLVRTDGQNVSVLESPDPVHPVAQEKGVYDFRDNNRPLGLPLKGLRGRQVFVLVASMRPLDVKGEIEPLVADYLRKGAPIHSADWAVDGFEIEVGG